MKRIFSAIIYASLFVPVILFAQAIDWENQSDYQVSEEEFSAAVAPFRSVGDVEVGEHTVPTVVAIPFGEEALTSETFAVFDNESKVFVPYFFKKDVSVDGAKIMANSVAVDSQNMTDGDIDTFTDFPLPLSRSGNVRVTLFSDVPVTSSSLFLQLSPHVSLPYLIEVRTKNAREEHIVYAQNRITDTTIRFPRTTAQEWIIDMAYIQPLRIAELKLIQEIDWRESSRELRFLALPGHSYQVFYDPEGVVQIKTGEAGNLQGDKGVDTVPPIMAYKNPLYIPSDIDEDGVIDVFDNCVNVANGDQIDLDGNRRGDACDDFDKDGHINSRDNCPEHPNGAQKDTDGDGVGDICDTEESRFTEKYAWLPWLGLGFVAIVLGGLLAVTVRSVRGKDISQDGESSQNGSADGKDQG